MKPKTSILIALLSLSLACSGAPEIQKTEQPHGTDAPLAATEPVEESGPLPGNEPPSIEIPVYKAVGVGQEISFGLEVIDTELDQVAVSLLHKPESASFDPVTLTVTWKPQKGDMPHGSFVVRLVETQREGGAVRTFDHPFSIRVEKSKIALPTATPLSPAVDTLLTIHDQRRLEDVNRKWTLTAMLSYAAQNTLESMGSDAANLKVAAPDALYHSFLKEFAAANNNPIIDPDSPRFDKKGFGNANEWKIIAVRPRLDKAWHEVRIVYRAPSPIPTYAMFKLRPTRESAPPEAREYNNREFGKMALEAFFRDGKLNQSMYRNPKEHAKAVLSFLDAVTSHKGTEPWAHGSFLGLPCESRLGGGSQRDPSGGYASGDAWGWHVMKVKDKGGVLAFHNVPIKGFATAVAPAPDGKSWAMTCAPPFDASHDAHDPALTGLCRETGHVDLPAAAGGMVDFEGNRQGAAVSSLVDASNQFIAHKRDLSLRELPLRDPRRDLFEEKGMTCSECHTRNFGVRDMRDPTAYDPTAGVPTRLNKSLPPSYFVFVPTTHWQPYMIDFQHKQECKAKVNLKAFTGVDTDLSCPLNADER